MEFMLASSNAHKVVELTELLSDADIKIQAAPEKLEVVEDGDSYQENAYKKAYAYYKKFNRPVVADDSGINVVALPDQLGIYSARYGGEGLNDSERCELLLTSMQGNRERAASFTCVLCFYLSDKEIYFFEGVVNGSIGDKVTGNGGFGYDPLFFPEGREGSSLAELPDWKKENSHRARAAKRALDFFKAQGQS